MITVVVIWRIDLKWATREAERSVGLGSLDSGAENGSGPTNGRR